MEESLEDYSTFSPSTLSPPESGLKVKGKGKSHSQSDSEGPSEMVKTCDKCRRKKTKCRSCRPQSPSSPILAAATRSVEPDAPDTALEDGADDTLQASGVTQVCAAPGAITKMTGLQSPVPNLTSQASRLGLKHQSLASGHPAVSSSTFTDEPASPAPDPITGADNHPSRIVILSVTAANVPAHLKVMPSQGNLNGSAPTPAPVPAPTAAASRAPSAAPPPSAMPAEAAEHGAATRVYINTKVTYHLLAGMKELAKHKPENPLRVLGEFLLARSAQYETGSATTTSTAAGASAAAGEDNVMGDE